MLDNAELKLLQKEAAQHPGDVEMPVHAGMENDDRD